MDNQNYSKKDFMIAMDEALRLHQMECEDEKKELLFLFYVELVEMNKMMNLTGITEMKDVIYKHFLDCMLIEKFELLKDGMKIIDVGTGAGFPGLVLAIMYEKMHFVLMDSLQKRISFLQELSEKLKLENVSFIHSRAEDLAFQTEYREVFDVATSRAVANLSTLSEYCLPFVKKDRFFIAYKSQDIDEEVKNASRAFSILGGETERIEHFPLNFENSRRSLVVVRKKKTTPKKYPRKAGTPSKHPL